MIAGDKDAEPLRSGPWHRGGVWPFWLMALAILAVDLADGVLFLGDVDDRMRALQIRHLLGSGTWFDPTFPFIAMPEPYLSPWSRLVDLPYLSITWLLAPFAGIDTAFKIATLAWPPILLFGFCAAAVGVARAVAAARLSLMELAGMAIVMTYALWEFTPGRIDHHNVQLVLMMAMLAGFCLGGGEAEARRAGAGGVLAGCSAVLSVTVGLECLPFILSAFGLVVPFAVLGDRNARQRLACAGIAMVVSSVLSGLIFIGPSAMLTTACDAWSAPWIVVMIGGGLILSAFALPQMARLRAIPQLLFLGVAAVALLAVLAILFPACLNGPYAMVDGISRSFWLDRVAQEESALAFVADRQYGALAILGLCAFILIATVPCAGEVARKGDWRMLLVWLIALTAFALTLWQIRFVRFAPAFAALLLPWLLVAMRGKKGFMAVPLVMAAIFLSVGGVVLALVLTPERIRQYDAVDLMTWDQCEGADFSGIEDLAPAHIIAPPGLSFPIAEIAARSDGAITISSLSFHRAAPGISRVATAFSSKDSDARAKALAPFSVVAVCARETSIDLSDAPLYAALASGKGWPGLLPIGAQPENGLRLFRLDHPNLR